MKGAIIKITYFITFVMIPLYVFSNTEKPYNELQIVELPKVFLIGEHAEEFDAASTEYQLQLLDACKQDMNLAYFKWLSMLQQMENYAETIDYDIKGAKMWIKVFWAADGKIDHIAYYLKPHSKNMDVDKLTAFFMSFMNHYTFPLQAEEKFSNYGSATFPVLAKRKKVEDNN